MDTSRCEYDRSSRPIEFWAALLVTTEHPESFSELDLEAAISLALGSITDETSPRTLCLALYVVGKSVLLLRCRYPAWREWVAHFAILAGERAADLGDQTLRARSDALFVDLIRATKLRPDSGEG